jgi:hypothetical protein
MIAPYINYDHPDLLYISTSPAERIKLRRDGWIRLIDHEPKRWLGYKYGAPGCNGLWRKTEHGTWVHVAVTYADVDEIT